MGGLLTLPVVEDNNGDDDGDDDQKEDGDTEAYPPLLAGCASGTNCLGGVTRACFRILLDMGSGLLDGIDRFVLLFN